MWRGALAGIGSTGGGGTGGGSTTNLLQNPGFEANGGYTQTASNWMEWSNTFGVNASYVETPDPRTGTCSLAHYAGQAYNAYTFQQVTGLTNGRFRLRAYAKGGGSFVSVGIQAKNPDNGTSLGWTSITPTGTYTLYEIANITVSNGKLEVALWSQSSATNAWLRVDDVELVRTGN
jgi:hypothetical protein